METSENRKNSIKSLFSIEQKFARKTHFPWEYYNDWDSNQVFRLVPTVLHLSAANGKEFCFCILKK
jgi:hypothetical protein